MADFFDQIEFDDAEHMEQLSRLMFELRRSRDHLLTQYGVADAEALLTRLRNGEVAEHPAYEHYLSLRILETTREDVRAELRDFLPKARTL